METVREHSLVKRFFIFTATALFVPFASVVAGIMRISLATSPLRFAISEPRPERLKCLASRFDYRLVAVPGTGVQEFPERLPHRADLVAVTGEERETCPVRESWHACEMPCDNLPAKSGTFENVEAAESWQHPIDARQGVTPGQSGNRIRGIAHRQQVVLKKRSLSASGPVEAELRPVRRGFDPALQRFVISEEPPQQSSVLADRLGPIEWIELTLDRLVLQTGPAPKMDEQIHRICHVRVSVPIVEDRDLPTRIIRPVHRCRPERPVTIEDAIRLYGWKTQSFA